MHTCKLTLVSSLGLSSSSTQFSCDPTDKTVQQTNLPSPGARNKVKGLSSISRMSTSPGTASASEDPSRDDDDTPEGVVTVDSG